MDLDEFLDGQPHTQQVSMPNGSQENSYFLEPTAVDIRRLMDAEVSNDREKYIYASQELVAACLYDPRLNRSAFEGEDYHKCRQLNFTTCENMTKTIIDIGVC